MAKRKSCIAGEFVIERAESETITVYKIYDNTLGGLREAAAAIGFEINEKSNTRNNGAQLIKFVNEKAGIDDKNQAQWRGGTLFPAISNFTYYEQSISKGVD